jgi:hypothetical protein
MVAAAVVGSAVVGGVASNMAAGTQADAANRSADMQQQAAQDAAGRLQPYAAAGQQALNPLWSAMGYTNQSDPAAVSQAQSKLQGLIDLKNKNGWSGQIDQAISSAQSELESAQKGPLAVDPNSTLQKQFSFNPSDLQNTPGYQFTMQQGLRGVQNQMSSQGLGLSGAQIKGAETYATGLADNTYNQQYNNALSTYNTNYQTASNNVNRLQNMVNMGQNSAAGQGQAGMAGAAGAGNYTTQAGNATASGYMGMANAANSGAQNYMTYNALYGDSANSGTPSSVNLGDTFSGFNF